MTVMVKAEGLGKLYRLGGGVGRYGDLRSSLVQGARRLAGLEAREGRAEAEVWALRDLSFEVPRGEVLGVIGANGSGKSTLLKILARITEPTEGHAEIRGRVGSLLEVGTGFHPDLTGRENVFLGGALLGLRRAEIARAMDEVLAFAGVERFADTPVKHYSSGMYMRLAFSVAAHLRADILLVDEVLAVGDVGFQRKCLGKIGEVVGQGRTALFVSHSLPHVLSLCPRALWLHEGRLREWGPSAEVVERYLKSSGEQPEGGGRRLADLPRAPERRVVMEDGDLNGAPLVGRHQAEPGSRIRFRIRLRTVEPLKGCVLAIHFNNETQVCVYSVNSSWRTEGFDLPAGGAEILCDIPRLPLAPGLYSLSAWLMSWPHAVDVVEQIATVEVLRTSAPGLRELPSPTQGYFLSESEWEVRTGSPPCP